MKRLTFLLLAVAMTLSSFGQEKKPLSPKATVEGKIGASKITIVYSQPSARGRKMLGGIEAYGKVWRTGANEATTIEFDKPVKIEGKDVPAGKYALFTIPNEKQWTIILNKESNQMGAFNYQEDKDLLRVNVASAKTPAFVETFNISIGKDDIQLKWEDTAVSVKIKG